jgi:plasmid stabilization system protein ParE
MIERVIYTPEARTDVVDAYGWYESREPGLGGDFLRAVEACVLVLQRHPLLLRIAIKPLRRALVRRFPYEIFYRPEKDQLTIHAVFHCAQDPAKWKRRIKP